MNEEACTCGCSTPVIPDEACAGECGCSTGDKPEGSESTTAATR